MSAITTEQVAGELTAQQKYSAGLRELADWYDAHPEAPAPYRVIPSVWFQATPEQMRAIGEGEKDYSQDNLFQFIVTGEHFKLEFYTSRARVCEKKVVGYREIPERVLPATPETVIPASREEIVEWECKESLLAPEVSA